MQFLLVPEADSHLFGRDLMTQLGISLHVKKNKIQASPYCSSDASSLEQPFPLFVNVNKAIALGVLTQKHGGQRVAFLSKFLDPVT
jgi:hypothetical protein